MSRWLVVILVMLAAGIAGSLPLRAPQAARDTSDEILVRLAEDGGVSVFVGPDSLGLREVPLDAARFGDGNAATTRDTIAALQPVLVELAGSMERESNDTSRMHMRVETAPRARILWLTWLLQMGVDPGVGICQYDLSSRGSAETVTWVLPSDGYLAVDGLIHRPPVFPDMYVVIEPPAPDHLGRITLRVERFRRDEPRRRRGPFGPRGSEGAPPAFPTVTLECELDEEGTPTPLGPLVAAVRRLRGLEREPEALWLQLTYPDGEVGDGLPVRTLLDAFAALRGIEDVHVEMGPAVRRRLDRRGER